MLRPLLSILNYAQEDEGTSKTVRTMPTVQTCDHTVHTERKFCPLGSHCVDTCLCSNHDLDLLCFMTTQFLSPEDALIKVLVIIRYTHICQNKKKKYGFNSILECKCRRHLCLNKYRNLKEINVFSWQQRMTLQAQTRWTGGRLVNRNFPKLSRPALTWVRPRMSSSSWGTAWGCLQ